MVNYVDWLCGFSCVWWGFEYFGDGCCCGIVVIGNWSNGCVIDWFDIGGYCFVMCFG